MIILSAPGPTQSAPTGAISLDELPPRASGIVEAVDASGAGQPLDRNRLLNEIGFVPGETVTVLARAWPGGDPIVVQVGASRFALRRAEAACVRVSRAP